MIVVTGAAGFIAANLARALLAAGMGDLLLVDHFPPDDSRAHTMTGLEFVPRMDRDLFLDWFTDHAEEVSFVFHLGARTDTSEFNFRVLDSLNLSYSKAIWEICTAKQVPLIYASSAATYGIGEAGFNDDEKLIPSLKPLNPYGLSKQLFDMYVLEQQEHPPFWAGLKFFNVYGPYEAHKGRMASVIFHAYQQIRDTGLLKLFQSHRPDIRDGEQLRDFIHVDDVVSVCLYLYHTRPANGIYNVGTGNAESFNELAAAVFDAMGLPLALDYIPIPIDIRDKYQYYTQASMNKLLSTGYDRPFASLKQGASSYVRFLQ